MKKLIINILILAFSILAAAFALSAVSVPAPSSPSWFEHVDLMQMLIGGLGIMVLFFLVRTLKKIDGNQARLFDLIDGLRREFYTLQGEHNMMMAGKGSHADPVCPKCRSALSERPD